MRVVRFAVHRPVATTVCFLAAAMMGVYSFFRLSVDFLPEIDVPRLLVRTDVPGMNVRDVDEYVTSPLEATISAVSGVSRIESVSRDGLSLVDVRFRWGSDMDLGFIQLRGYLDQVRLPRAADHPNILRFDPSAAPVMTLVVTGERVENPRSTRDYHEALTELKGVAEAVVKRRLEQLDGVAWVQVAGGLDREINVFLDVEKSRRYGVGFTEVERSLEQFNVAGLGGVIRDGYSEFPLRIQAEFTSLDEIRQIPVRLEPRLIRLKEVARIEEGYQQRRGYTRFNGHEVITLHLFKEAGANTVKTSRRVYGDLYRFSRDYPDFAVRAVFDQAEFIRESIDSVLQALYLGSVFAILTLVYFLRDLRNPLVVGLSIPVSMVTTFVLMYLLDIHFNIISLGGLALAMGILVDNSIVVFENIYRHRETGLAPGEAAVTGTTEVGLAITASTLTTMAVFMPMVYVEGIAGALFYQQAVTISLSLAVSLLVSITLLPMLSSRSQGNEASVPSRPQAGTGGPAPVFLRPVRFCFRLFGRALFLLLRLPLRLFTWSVHLFQRMFSSISTLYERVLSRALDHRGKVLGAVLLLLLLSVWMAEHLDREVMPSVDRKHLVVRAQLPAEASLAATTAEVTRLERLLLQEEGVRSVLSSVGITGRVDLKRQPGPNKAVMDIEIEEGMSSREVAADLERVFVDFSGMTFVVEQPETVFEHLFQTRDASFDLRIVGPGVETLADLGGQIVEYLQQTKGFVNPSSNLRPSKRALNLVVDRNAVITYGIRVADLTDFIERQLQGSTPTQFLDFVEHIDIRLLPEGRDDMDPWNLLNMHYPVRREGRTVEVPLSELIRLDPGLGYEEIHREDHALTVTITAGLEGIDLAQAHARLAPLLDRLEVPGGYWIDTGSQEAERQEQYRSLYVVLAISVTLVYFILAAQFESLVVPFVIVAAVPLAVAGVVLTLWLTGHSLNVMSLLGCIVLVGIVVNDSIVKVDFIHSHFRVGGDLRAAIAEAGRMRFRPICMTTMTTVCGLLPMALSSGSGAELRHPLAWAVVGGITLASLLTLVVVPLLYSVVVKTRG